MSAFLKLFSDADCTQEAATVTGHSFAVAKAAAGDVSLQLQAVPSGMPAFGVLSIGSEVVQFYGQSDASGNLAGNTINLGNPLASDYPAGTGASELLYSLPVGDQSAGISNDGSNATPNANNTAGWYLKNVGDQTAQSAAMSTSQSLPSTVEGSADTQLSTDGKAYSQSLSLGNIAPGAVVQVFVVVLVPQGQSAAHNPNQCVIETSYETI